MPVELRKIQVTGGSTHIVSLPKKWIDRNRLGRSDTVAIHEEPDGSLLLVPRGEGRSAIRKVTVELPLDPRDEDVVRRLVGAYVAGSDEILVRAAGGRLDPRIRQAVRNMTRDLVGLEIVEETGSSMTLHDLVGVAAMDLRKSVTRMHRIARIMFDDALQALQGRDAELARDVADRDDELDRLLWMVSKQMHGLLEQPRLATRLEVPPAQALNYFLVARSLERIGDHATKMATNIALLEGRRIPEAAVAALAQQGAIVRDVWEEAIGSLRSPDFAAASRAADHGVQAARWRVKFPAQLARLNPETVGPLILLADSLDRVRGYAVDIAETAMNHTFQ